MCWVCCSVVTGPRMTEIRWEMMKDLKEKWIEWMWKMMQEKAYMVTEMVHLLACNQIDLSVDFQGPA